MKHIVCSHLSRHLSANSIMITPLQHDFQRGLSCDTLSFTNGLRFSIFAVKSNFIFLDFAKAFYSMPHARLPLKAHHYGIRGKLNEWLRDILSDCWQHVVVNGPCSDWSNVWSGVPQDTVLGPVLFLLYINDVLTGISSKVGLFADDTVLFWQLCCPDDQDHRLQHDLHQLEQWAAKWQMRLAPTKCFVLSVTLHTNSLHFSYWLCDTGLDEVKYYKYLGAMQCDEVKTKANKILCVLHRNLSSCNQVIFSRCI